MADTKKKRPRQTLQRFRWWQQFNRSLFYLSLIDPEGQKQVYAVDVRHGENSEYSKPRTQLYLNEKLVTEKKMPASFAVPGGNIEVAASMYGMKRCHYVTTSGEEYQLVPDAKSAEGHRARLKHNHPIMSSLLGFFSFVILLVSLALLVVQGLELLTQIPTVNDYVGTFESPIHLSSGVNTALGVAAVLASTERALRLRYSRLLDGSSDLGDFTDFDIDLSDINK